MEKERKIFKMLYMAEILVLIGMLLDGVAGSFFTAVEDGSATAGGIAAGTVLGIIAGILVLVGGIIRVVNIIKGKSVSRYLGIALAFNILVIVLTVVGAMFPEGTATFFTSRVSKLSDAMNLIVSVCVIYAILDAAKTEKNFALAETAQKTEFVFFVITLLAIFSDNFTALLTTGGAAIAVVGVAYIALLVIAYVMYLKLLRRAYTEL